jgi:ribulose-5-phosphate 4-epimerase/fuculose-1-phosphate aldolase
MTAFHNQLKELKRVSKMIGASSAFAQGGGGNTSIKISPSEMLVKASGYRLTHAAEQSGFVLVNYRNACAYYDKVASKRTQNEEGSVRFLLENTRDISSGRKLRPSIETGFHSFLNTCVIHTHSVYANILNCSREGEALFSKIFASRAGFLWVPYANPGLSLTLLIRRMVADYRKSFGRFPEVIFLQNHGVIVTADTMRRCMSLHAQVNDSIRRYFGIAGAYPSPRLVSRGSDLQVSRTAFLKKMLRDGILSPRFFRDTLFPDQAVYLGGHISFSPKKGFAKVVIDAKRCEISYRTQYHDALAIEETILAYGVLRRELARARLRPHPIHMTHAGDLREMESEKYRMRIMKEAS